MNARVVIHDLYQLCLNKSWPPSRRKDMLAVALVRLQEDTEGNGGLYWPKAILNIPMLYRNIACHMYNMHSLI